MDPVDANRRRVASQAIRHDRVNPQMPNGGCHDRPDGGCTAPQVFLDPGHQIIGQRLNGLFTTPTAGHGDVACKSST